MENNNIKQNIIVGIISDNEKSIPNENYNKYYESGIEKSATKIFEDSINYLKNDLLHVTDIKNVLLCFVNKDTTKAITFEANKRLFEIENNLYDLRENIYLDNKSVAYFTKILTIFNAEEHKHDTPAGSNQIARTLETIRSKYHDKYNFEEFTLRCVEIVWFNGANRKVIQVEFNNDLKENEYVLKKYVVKPTKEKEEVKSFKPSEQEKSFQKQINELLNFKPLKDYVSKFSPEDLEKMFKEFAEKNGIK